MFGASLATHKSATSSCCLACAFSRSPAGRAARSAFGIPAVWMVWVARARMRSQEKARRYSSTNIVVLYNKQMNTTHSEKDTK